MQKKLETITVGAGCFWCIEAQFKCIPGVKNVVSGYSGGHTKNPTYEEICTGKTNHAEVCQVEYDPTEIPIEQLLIMFWRCHDPTQLNRQGQDIGTQYRSVIFYHNEDQKNIASKCKNKLNENKIYKDPIVTEVSPFINFYKAEAYHQNYYENNAEKAYCLTIIKPKLEKFLDALKK